MSLQKANIITNEGKDIIARFIHLMQEMILKKILFVAASPDEIYERKVTQEELHPIICTLKSTAEAGNSAKRIRYNDTSVQPQSEV